MNSKIYQICHNLKSEIITSKIYLDVLESESLMEKDEEVITLAIIKDKASDKYNDFLKYYKEDSIEVINARKELYKAKADFESHPLVRDYLRKYQLLRTTLEEINDIIFEGFKTNLCPNAK